MSDHLKLFAPKYDEKFLKPKFETDWHDALLDVGIATLKAGLTNVLTIGSGRGEIFGAWKGLGVVEAGHNLGHMDQPDNPIWIKIRQYNCRMLVKLMQRRYMKFYQIKMKNLLIYIFIESLLMMAHLILLANKRYQMPISN